MGGVFATGPDIRIRNSRSVTDTYNKIVSQEKMGFAEFKMMLFIYLGCPQNDKNRISIGFNFGPLMSAVCIFNSQLMKIKFALHP